MKKFSCVLSLVVFVAGFSILTLDVRAQGDKEKNIKSAAKTADNASKALNEVMAVPDNAIPDSLLRKAKAIAVFPGVVKAAFGIGGSGGKGLVTRRIKSGWSAPAVFKLASGSVGFQIGASATDIVMLFMTEDSLKNLLADKFEIGGEASAAAGPVGRTAQASTDAQMKAQILSYSRSRGLFAGISLTGAVINPDNNVNQSLYMLDAKDILIGVNKVAIADIPAATKGFHQTVTTQAK